MPTPLPIVIESTQYTESADAVLIQFSAASGTGIFAGTQLCHTTQPALIARIPADIAAVVGDRWGNAEVQAELLAYLAANGVDAVIVEGS